MALATLRLSDTELQVERTLYTFARKDDADAFERCLSDTAIDHCYRSHPPLSAQPIAPGEHPQDPGRGSTISPSHDGRP